MCGGAFSCQTENTWLGTARARLGYSFGRFMPYVTGGAAFGDIKTTINGARQRERHQGRLDGAAAALKPSSAVRGPPRSNICYVDLGSGATILGSDTKFESDIVRAGLNYRF